MCQRCEHEHKRYYNLNGLGDGGGLFRGGGYRYNHWKYVVVGKGRRGVIGGQFINTNTNMNINIPGERDSG